MDIQCTLEDVKNVVGRNLDLAIEYSLEELDWDDNSINRQALSNVFIGILTDREREETCQSVSV